MSIEQQIYDRLSTVTANVYPDTPTEDTQLPFVVYRVGSTEPQLTTTGVSGVTKYVIEVDAYAVTKAEVTSLQASVRSQLHGYRGGNIQGAFLQGEGAEEIDLGFHGVQSFTVFSTNSTITATANSTGTVVTGANSVTLSACSHTLSLDCDGLMLDGVPVGAGGDSLPEQGGQSGKYLVTDGTDANWQTLSIPAEFARTDLENNFGVEQHFQEISCTQLNGGGADFTGSVEAVGGFFKNGVEIENAANTELTVTSLNVTTGNITSDGFTIQDNVGGGTLRIDGAGLTYNDAEVVDELNFSSYLPGNLAVTDSNNNFTADQTINGNPVVTDDMLADYARTDSSNNFEAAQTITSSGDGEQLTLTNSTYGRSIRFGWEGGGAIPHINADDSLILRASNLVQMLPNSSTYGIQFGAPNLNDRTMSNQVGDTILYAVASTFKPLVVRGATSQTADLTQWQDSTGAVLASVTADGIFKQGGVPVGIGLNIDGGSPSTVMGFSGIIDGGTI